MKCIIKSLYVCVEDMTRAIEFYEKLFNQTVTIRDDVYSIFDIGGFRYGLFAYRLKNEVHTYGNNCLPSIEVEDLATLEHITKNLSVVFPLTQINCNWVIEVMDSEQNHIEITAPVY